MKDVIIDNYRYITFFTEGVPYGAFFNSITPCSHVLRSLAIDLFIFNNIFSEIFDHNFGSAIVFSPNPADLKKFTNIESENVCDILEDSKISVKKLFNKKATVEAFDLNVGYYPYDILHICSHGGETDGYYVVQEFTDRLGLRHTIEYEEVVGFSPDEGNLVNVASKKIFRYLDGFPWRSQELKNQNYSQDVYTDMFKAISEENENEELSRKKIDYLIEGSCHIKCYDDIHQGQFHALASQNYPFIFNNTCNSWGDFETQLIANGCRAYIGTLWKVGNEVATRAADIFYRNAFYSNIINAANCMNNAIDSEKYKDIYLFCGLHFSSLKRQGSLANEKIINEIAASLKKWLEKVRDLKSDEQRRNTLRIIQFLCKELTPYFDTHDIFNLIYRSVQTSYYLRSMLHLRLTS